MNEGIAKIEEKPKPAVDSPFRRPVVLPIRPVPQSTSSSSPQKNVQPSSPPVRSYAYPSPRDLAPDRSPPETLLWQPLVQTKDGTAEVTFGLPPNAGTYRIRVQGHTADGRLGAVAEKLESRPPTDGTSK